MFTTPFKRFLSSIRRFASLVPGFFFVIILFIASCQANEAKLAPPPDFQLVAEVDLSDQSYDEEIVGKFTVAETAVTTLFYTLPNADTSYFDLSLIGPADDSLVILHSENYRTDKNGGGTWEQNLTPGTYQLILTAEPGPGVLSVYWGRS